MRVAHAHARAVAGGDSKAVEMFEARFRLGVGGVVVAVVLSGVTGAPCPIIRTHYNCTVRSTRDGTFVLMMPDTVVVRVMCSCG